MATPQRTRSTAEAEPAASLEAAAPPDRLAGTFVECCDCYTICPCWIDDTPDEEHCSGIYLWVFDDTSAIDGRSLKGSSLAIAAYHGNRSGTQSVLFTDALLPAEIRETLSIAFTGRPDKPLGPRRERPRLSSLDDLRRLIGTVVMHKPATIVHTFEPATGWTLQISSGTECLIEAAGQDLRVRGASAPLTLKDTALASEFGITDEVRVQAMGKFNFNVNALPLGSFAYHGRAGMAGAFHYV